jgi:hypothetical protein
MSLVACKTVRAQVCRLSTQRHSRHYLPFLTMSCDLTEWLLGRSRIEVPIAAILNPSQDIVFLPTDLQTVQEGEEWVSGLIAPWSAVPRGRLRQRLLLHRECRVEIDLRGFH